MLNVPIYRAKKIDSDEWVEGTGITDDFLKINTYEQFKKEDKIWLWSDYKWVEILPSTLAIHLPSMIDKDGKKIFASLSENGKGGDVINFLDSEGRDSETTVIYKDYVIFPFDWINSNICKVVEIQKKAK